MARQSESRCARLGGGTPDSYPTTGLSTNSSPANARHRGHGTRSSPGTTKTFEMPTTIALRLRMAPATTASPRYAANTATESWSRSSARNNPLGRLRGDAHDAKRHQHQHQHQPHARADAIKPGAWPSLSISDPSQRFALVTVVQRPASASTIFPGSGRSSNARQGGRHPPVPAPEQRH